jgi:predicted TIM-barrel fold metal-dependent hydrolase
MKGIVPALDRGMQVTRELRASSRAAADHLAQVANDGVVRARTDLSALTTTVAQTLVVAGYVETEKAKRNVRAAADGAAGLLDAAGEDLKRDAATLKGASTALSAVERRLRAMVPDQASPSVEVARQASTISGRIVEAVARAYRKTKEAGAEAARQAVDGVTETAADAASVASGLTRGLSGLEAELAAISRTAAASMKPLALRANRSLDLVEADARDLVNYAAREVRAAIDQGATQTSRGIDGAARAADAKVQSALTTGEALLKQFRDFAGIAGMETVAIADKAVQANLGTVQSIPPSTQSERLSMMMVMPMDMDFGHLEGYDGKQIYQKVETRQVQETLLRPIKIPGAPSKVMKRRPLPPGSKFSPRTVPGAPGGPVELRVVEEKGPFYYYHQVRHDLPIRELVWLPQKEFRQFQDYPKQVKHTLAAAAAHPWTLLPLYHYDPRRWSQPTGSPRKTEAFDGKTREVYPQAWDEPFKRYFQQEGGRPFVGIKLYTALGYRPWDPRLKHQPDFYDKCISLELPIVCHCSPAGMYSFDRPFFAADDAKRRGEPLDKVRRETKALMERRGVEADWEEYWFSEHYVSPRAWRKVLDQPKYRQLRLCLAHFGGDDAAFTTWKQKEAVPGAAGAGGGRRTIENWDTELIQLSREFENVYIDISFFVFDGERVGRFRKALLDNPHLRDKLLFGTDWWMTEKDGINYKGFVAQTRRALDSIDPELWPRFSWINPLRFYRLKENAKSIHTALMAAQAGAPEDDGGRLRSIDRGLSVLQSLHPGGIGGK